MSEVPGRFPVSIDGRTYVAALEGFQRQSLQTIREQSDTSEVPGEHSLSPYDLWRRSQDRWIQGAGQEHFDKSDSSPRRFNTSEGIDPWDDGYLKLLPDVESGQTTLVSKPMIVMVGDRLYWNHGSDYLRYTSEIDFSTTTDTGTFPSDVVDLASDGFNVYAATASDGVHIVDRDSDTPIKLNNLVADSVWYVKGRLMASAGADLYNITDPDSTTAPDSLTPDIINDDWRWTDAGESGDSIYIAGLSGDKSMVYRIVVRDDGTGLASPVVAAELPDGEVCNTVYGYVGMVFLGTSKGLRVASISNGFLNYGPLLEVGDVQDLEPQGSFVWYTRGSDGLGRVNLRDEFLAPLQPAYANDLESVGSGDVSGVVTFGGKRVFAQDTGVYIESNSLINSGIIWVGSIGFDLPDQKSFEYVSVAHEPLSADAAVNVVPLVDRGVVSGDFTSNEDGSTGRENMEIHVVGDRLELQIELQGDVKLSRWTLRALPIPNKGEAIQIPLLLREAVEDHNGGVVHVDPQVEFDALKQVERDGAPVDVELFGETLRVVIDGVQLGPDLDYTADKSYVQGVCTVLLRSWAV